MKMEDKDFLIFIFTLLLCFSFFINIVFLEQIIFSEKHITEAKSLDDTINEEITLLVKHNDVYYMKGIATAYTPSAGGINSDSDPLVTSTMKPAKNGVIAVNPDVIPYGSDVLIICDDVVIQGQAWDTGGAMRKNPQQVDILMENHANAINWGRREAYIIWW